MGEYDAARNQGVSFDGLWLRINLMDIFVASNDNLWICLSFGWREGCIVDVWIYFIFLGEYYTQA